MKEKIEKTLTSIKIEKKELKMGDTWPHLDLIAIELKKHHKDEASLGCVYTVISDFVKKATMGDVQNTEESFVLPDYLGQERFSKLTNDILDYFLSIPRSYSFYFSIGSLKGAIPKSLKVLPGVEIVFIEAQSIKKSILGSIAYGLLEIFSPPTNFPPMDAFFIKIDAEGIFCGDTNDSAFKRAFEKLKHVMTYGLAKKIFSMNGYTSNPGCSVMKYWCFCQDKEEKGISSEFVQLPGFLGEKLNLLQINSEALPDLNLSFEDLERLYKAKNDVKDIFSAMEWSFDANCASDQTMSFLNVCFGLESILGDDADQGGLTEKMADRCSFIAATAREDRKDIRENFKKIYKIRCKIVHGRKKYLSDDEAHFRFYAQNLLDHLIKREIRAAIK